MITQPEEHDHAPRISGPDDPCLAYGLLRVSPMEMEGAPIANRLAVLRRSETASRVSATGSVHDLLPI